MLTIYNLFIFFSLNIFLVNTLYIREKKYISITEFYIIFIWHFLFSIIYFFYVSIFGGDTNGYLEYAKNYIEFERSYPLNLGNGSSLIYNMVYFFYNDLRLDILNIISIFNFIGFVGLIYFFKTLKDITKKIDTKYFLIKNLHYLIIFIPSLSFWTSGIGKEPLVFLSISLFVYSLNKKKCNYFMLLLTFVILFLVRWQFSAIMLLSTLFVFKVNDIPKYIKDIKVVTLLLVGFVIINLITAYFFHFHAFKLDPILNSIYKRQTYTAGTDLFVNFDATFIQIILNYLFSPINFKSILFSVVSIENIYIIFLIFLLLINFKRNNLQYINLAILSFIILFLLTVPFATFNIGIAIRQKWVVLIVIFVLFASGLKTHEKK